MATLTREAMGVNPGLEAAPGTWESWTDEDRWELGPDPADEQWWAEHCPSNGTDYDVEHIDIDEHAAVEAAAVDSLAMGLIPADVARAINRTSLAGSDAADSIIHSGSDPAWCGCERCVWDRTSLFAE